MAPLASDISIELDSPRNRLAHDLWNLVLGDDAGAQRTSYNLVGFQGLMEVEDLPRALMYLVHEDTHFSAADLVLLPAAQGFASRGEVLAQLLIEGFACESPEVLPHRLALLVPKGLHGLGAVFPLGAQPRAPATNQIFALRAGPIREASNRAPLALVQTPGVSGDVARCF